MERIAPIEKRKQTTNTHECTRSGKYSNCHRSVKITIIKTVFVVVFNMTTNQGIHFQSLFSWYLLHDVN